MSTSHLGEINERIEKIFHSGKKRKGIETNLEAIWCFGSRRYRLTREEVRDSNIEILHNMLTNDNG